MAWCLVGGAVALGQGLSPGPQDGAIAEALARGDVSFAYEYIKGIIRH